MKIHNYFIIGCIILLSIIQISFAQTIHNLIRNPGFEGEWNGIDHAQVPLYGEHIDEKPPAWWIGFHTSGGADLEAWFTDSLADPGPQDPRFTYNTGRLGDGAPCGLLPSPWDSATNRPIAQAHTGKFYVGFDAANGGDREGVQQYLGCWLNSGIYEISGWFSRPYDCRNINNKIFLSRKRGQREKRIIKVESDRGDHNIGQWYPFSESFTLHANDNNDRELDWIAITGEFVGVNQYENYMFFDDINLHRPCDIQNHCSRTSGQICPVILTPA